MTTALDIINLAQESAGNLGVGQTLLSEDVAKGLRVLNMMLGQWNRNRWLVYHLVDTAFTCTGAQSYTVGSGGNFNIARPDRLEAAYIRQINVQSPNQIDYPLQILESREDYSLLIPMKQLQASPSYAIFYDSGYPTGTLYPYPVPSSQFELHIVTKSPLTTFATAATTVTLPPEYEEALWSNLAVRLCPLYQLPLPPEVVAIAKASRNTLRKANAQIPRLTMPDPLQRPYRYNIFSDQTY